MMALNGVEIEDTFAEMFLKLEISPANPLFSKIFHNVHISRRIS